MAERAERYILTALGFAAAAVWAAVGFEAAVGCLAAAAGGYIVATVRQRHTLHDVVVGAGSRLARTRSAGRSSTRSARPRDARARPTHALLVPTGRPLADGGAGSSTGENVGPYGW